MKIVLTAAITVLFFAQQVYSREIRAISGEHSNFSRIVLFFDNQSGWNLTRSSEGYSLKYKGEYADLDSTEIFKFIPKTRVLDVKHSENENIINFLVECECHADAFELKNGHVAIDFKDGPDPNELFLAESGWREYNTYIPGLKNSISSPNKEFQIDTSQANDLHNFLLSSLADAMNDGIIQPAKPDLVTVEPSLELESTLFDNISISPDPRSGVPTNNLDDENNFDDNCSGGDKYAFDGEIVDFIKNISELRRRILSGNFEIDRENLNSLAELYIAIGFGAEAISIFKDQSANSQHDLRMMSIAHVIDQMDIKGETGFEGTLNCDNALALWASITEVDSTDVMRFPEKEILRTLTMMSKELRNTIGPLIYAQASTRGSSQFESELSHILDLDPDVNLTDQIIRLEDLGDNEIQKISRRNSQLGNAAILELSRRYLSSAEIIDTKFLNDLEARAFELRNSSMGDDIGRNLIRLAASNGEITRSLSNIDRVYADGNVISPQLTDVVISALVQDTSDEAFVKNILKFRDLISQLGVSNDLIEDMLNRLANIGMGDIGDDLIDDLIASEIEKTRILVNMLISQNRRAEAISIIRDSGFEVQFPLVLYPQIPEIPSESIRRRALDNLSNEDSQRILWHLSDNALSEISETSRYSNDFALLQIVSSAENYLQRLPNFDALDDFSDIVDYANQQRRSVKSLLDQFPISE